MRAEFAESAEEGSYHAKVAKERQGTQRNFELIQMLLSDAWRSWRDLSSSARGYRNRDAPLLAGIITCTPDAPDALAERLDVALSEIQSWSRRLVRVRRDGTENEASVA